MKVQEDGSAGGGVEAGLPRTPPPTRRVGDFVFVSGQLSIDDEGSLVGPNSWERQAEQCLQRIQRELKPHGVTMDDVVSLTSYLVDAAGYPAYAAVRREICPRMHAAGTAVVVAGLLVEGALLEVKATAWCGESRTEST